VHDEQYWTVHAAFGGLLVVVAGVVPVTPVAAGVGAVVG